MELDCEMAMVITHTHTCTLGVVSCVKSKLTIRPINCVYNLQSVVAASVPVRLVVVNRINVSSQLVLLAGYS